MNPSSIPKTRSGLARSARMDGYPPNAIVPHHRPVTYKSTAAAHSCNSQKQNSLRFADWIVKKSSFIGLRLPECERFVHNDAPFLISIEQERPHTSRRT